MLWSILIAAIPERYHSAQGLLHSLLETQAVARHHDIELLYLMDNKRREVGAKRNALLDMACGQYVTYIDDDDEVAPDYVERIRGLIIKSRRGEAPVDVICFPQRCTIQPANVTHECSYSLAHHRDRKPELRRQLAPALDDKGQPLPATLNWTGPPAHTMAWRRELVGEIRFPEKTFGEDVAWVDAACEKAKTEMVLKGPPLYFYKFNAEGSATR